MGQLVVESALAIENVKRAKKTLDNLRMSELSSKEKKQLDFQEGLILEMNAKVATDPVLADEQFDAAVDKWDSVRNSKYQPSRLQATIARAELQLKRDKITRADAIDDLEDIRFTWRGDNFEFRLLRRLGALYLEEGRYRDGLDRLRQAVTYFPTNSEAPQVTQKMSKMFAKLYLEDAADALPPVTAIALYEEFKELTPAGERGDKMIQNLADRLVNVDLLDPAIKLLKSQIQFRLKGNEKARVGAQLTLAHILARQYEKALKVLDSTEIVGMPKELLSQRRHLRAKALMALKNREMALVVLNDDKSRNAELLRAEIFWNTRDWSKASQSLHLLLRNSGAKKNKSLDSRQKAYVLNFVIALTLSGNERGLRRARKDFSSKMAESSLKDAFNLITATNARGVLDYKLVKDKVMEAEKFQTFMASYRERLKNENLSDLVPRSAKPVTLNRSLLNNKESEIATNSQ
jgi:tetratricopeptide (TPR) repeat protein